VSGEGLGYGVQCLGGGGGGGGVRLRVVGLGCGVWVVGFGVRDLGCLESQIVDVRGFSLLCQGLGFSF